VSKREGTTYVGLDVHKKSINVSVLLAGSPSPEDEWQVANTPQSIKKMAKKVKRLATGPVVAAYEAGPCGYAPQRLLEELGITCQVVAPSMIPFKPGDRVKTDRRDARKIATYLRSGDLTEVHPPTPQEEAVRDLTRAREDIKHDQQRARHRLTKMLDRHGIRFTGGNHWTKRHREWLNRIRFEEEIAQQVFEGYLLTVEQADERLSRIEEQLEEVARSERYAEHEGWLRCLRGIDTVTAMTILAELYDFRRFRTPRQLMAFLGVTPGEHTTGNRVRRGPITKAGNAHVRRLLVEAAWSYRHRPSVSKYMRKRRDGQPAAVIAIADRAQERLHRKYFKLKEGYKKPHNVVTVAVARELVGFIWAVMNHREAA
jgi:transposase